MMEQAPDMQHTVRGVPGDVDQALRTNPDKQLVSLDQVIVAALAAETTGPRSRGDFSDLVGQWAADPAFDEVIASQRQIDASNWK